MELQLKFIGNPKAVQSFRFTRSGFKYQKKDVVEWKNWVRMQAVSQLPDGFEMLKDVPLRVEVEFIFSAPKSWSKKKLAKLTDGETIYKITKPDLTDNLMKGLIDALSGIIWERDQQICRVESVKKYGENAKTLLKVEKLV